MDQIKPLNNLVIRDLMFEVFKDKEFCHRNAYKYDFYNAATTMIGLSSGA